MKYYFYLLYYFEKNLGIDDILLDISGNEDKEIMEENELEFWNQKNKFQAIVKVKK